MKKIIILLTTAVLIYAGAWKASISKDEMTGERYAYASSPIVSPTKKMNFPYRDIKAWLGVGCDTNSEWVYVGFNSNPNLSDKKIEDGHNVIYTRIKFDENVKNVKMTQKWGAKFIHFSESWALGKKQTTKKDVITGIEKSNSILVELPWYENGNVYFKFSLKGSSAALKKIRSECMDN